VARTMGGRNGLPGVLPLATHCSPDPSEGPDSGEGVTFGSHAIRRDFRRLARIAAMSFTSLTELRGSRKRNPSEF